MFSLNPLSLEMTLYYVIYFKNYSHALSGQFELFTSKVITTAKYALVSRVLGEEQLQFWQPNKAFDISDTIYQEPLLRNEILRSQLRTIDLEFLEMELWYSYFIKPHTWFLGTLSFENCKGAALLKQVSSSLGNNQSSYRFVTLL